MESLETLERVRSLFGATPSPGAPLTGWTTAARLADGAGHGTADQAGATFDAYRPALQRAVDTLSANGRTDATLGGYVTDATDADNTFGDGGEHIVVTDPSAPGRFWLNLSDALSHHGVTAFDAGGR